MAGGPRGAGRVFPFREVLRFRGVGVLLGKRLRVAVSCGRGSGQVVSWEIRVSYRGGPDSIRWSWGLSRRSSFLPFLLASGVAVAGGGGMRPTRGGCCRLGCVRALGGKRGLSG